MEDTKPTTEQPSAATSSVGRASTPSVADFILTQMERLPRAVREHLASAALIETHNRAFNAANLTESEREIAYALELQVFFGFVDVEEFPALLLRFLATAERDDEKVRLLALDILGHVFLPAEALLGEVVETITDLDGDPAAYDVKPLELERLTFDEGAAQIAAAIPGVVADEASVARLRHIVESYLRGVRDETETKEMIMRQKKVGGLELPDAAAEEVMHVIATKAKLAKFVESLEEPKDDERAPVPEATSAAPASVSETVAVVREMEISVPESVPAVPPEVVPVVPPDEQPVPAPLTTDYGLPTKPALDPAAVKAIYSGTDEERAELAKRIAKFREVTGEDADKERDAFHEVIYPPDLGPVDPQFVVASLLAMAEDGSLTGALEDDLRSREMLTKFFADKGEQGKAFRFAEKPGASEFMNVFLQIVLRGFAGLNDADSARFGLRITNHLKKAGFSEYANLVAFDADLGAFRWMERVEL